MERLSGLVNLGILVLPVIFGCGKLPSMGDSQQVSQVASSEPPIPSSPPVSRDPINENNFWKIQFGMSVEEVNEILGRPADQKEELRFGGSLTMGNPTSFFWNGATNTIWVFFDENRFGQLVVRDMRLEK